MSPPRVSVVEKRLLKNAFFISARRLESSRGMGESHVTAVGQSFQILLFLSRAPRRSTRTSAIKQGPRCLTFCKSSLQMPGNVPRAQPPRLRGSFLRHRLQQPRAGPSALEGLPVVPQLGCLHWHFHPGHCLAKDFCWWMRAPAWICPPAAASAGPRPP